MRALLKCHASTRLPALTIESTKNSKLQCPAFDNNYYNHFEKNN